MKLLSNVLIIVADSQVMVLFGNYSVIRLTRVNVRLF